MIKPFTWLDKILIVTVCAALILGFFLGAFLFLLGLIDFV